MSGEREKARERARELARRHREAGDATGWFEAFYAEARGAAERVPWANLKPNLFLAEWLDAHAAPGRALIVGCGLGDDAEHLAARGFHVTAFDISGTAVGWCRSRFPSSAVEYTQADLLDPPPAWRAAFDFVFEANTLQVLPEQLRPRAIECLARCVRPHGRLLVVARARDESEPAGELPWPLTRAELSPLSLQHGLVEESFELLVDASEEPPVRRLRAAYRA